jgi:hypothetical protein
VVEHSVEGRQFHFRDPLGPLFYFLVPLGAILLVAAGMTGEPHAACAAVWPISYALFRLLSRQSPQDLRIGAEGLQVEPEGTEVRYGSIQSLRFNDQVPARNGTERRGRLEIIGRGGLRMSGVSDEAGMLCRYLLGRIPRCGSREVSGRLQKHLEEMLRSFDDDLVGSFVSRETLAVLRPNVLILGLSLLVACVVLAFLAALVTNAALGWAVATGAAGMVIGLVWLVDRNGKLHPTGLKEWRWSALVVSPWGLAIEQGDLVGKMSWDQVRKVEVGLRRGKLAITGQNRNSLTIEVEGAAFQIPDIYDRPLPIIHEWVTRYWDDERTDPMTKSV